MNAYARPLPRPTPLTRPFWDAARAGVLRIQRCDDCGRYRFYPTVVCAACGSHAATWTEMSGRGTLYSWIVVRQAIEPSWREVVPFTVAVVEQAEQNALLVTGTLTDIEPEQIRAGMPVEVWFDAVTDEATLLRWRPLPA